MKQDPATLVSQNVHKTIRKKFMPIYLNVLGKVAHDKKLAITRMYARMISIAEMKNVPFSGVTLKGYLLTVTCICLK